MSLFIGILCALLILLFAIGSHEFGHMMAAKACGVGVVEYSIGMGPLLWSKRIGETVYSVRAVPFGGYCAMYGEESAEASAQKAAKPEKGKRRKADYKMDWEPGRGLNDQAWWKRVLVYIAGPAMNLLSGVLACLLMVTFLGFAYVPVIDGTIEGYPAETSGIQVGDVICGVNGRTTLTYASYSEYLASHADVVADGYDLYVLRDGEPVVIRATYDPEDGMFGITLTSEEVPLTPGNVIAHTADLVRYMFNTVFDSVYMLANGTASASDLSGVVGITALITDSVEDALAEGVKAVLSVVMFMVALLAVNLGIMNMIPFPALDGGRTLMCLLEGLFRRKVPSKVEYAINAVGMVLLMCLLVFTLWNDLARVFAMISGAA